jgi:hypothetical protein
MRPALTRSMSKAMIVLFRCRGAAYCFPNLSMQRAALPGAHGPEGTRLACDHISRCLLRTHSSFAFY